MQFLTGDNERLQSITSVPAKDVFDNEILDFLEFVSKKLMKNKDALAYPDVVTFAFWIRKASLNNLKIRFTQGVDTKRRGKGVCFHIAPSNVPVNFAYSLVAGLLSGNANIVRVPSKEFEQVKLIADSINEGLTEFENLKPFVFLVRYERDKETNDLLSSFSDMRIIWGGDNTISEIRRSPLPARSGEITFADRYSIAVIDADTYLDVEDKKKIADDFYNDTFLSDQNACTSPRIVVWLGGKIEEAKKLFWENEIGLVSEKYEISAAQVVNKLSSAFLTALDSEGTRLEYKKDNLVFRISVNKADAKLMDHKDNSGFFFEYECNDITDIRDICNDKRCQTLSYIGDKDMFIPLIELGVKGIDRIVPIGHTMDFDLIWDGYNLIDSLSRRIAVI